MVSSLKQLKRFVPNLVEILVDWEQFRFILFEVVGDVDWLSWQLKYPLDITGSRLIDSFSIKR